MTLYIRLLLICVLIYIASVEGVQLKKRQLVVGRVGFRPGRSLAIGRGALLKPSGKRSLENAQLPMSLAPTVEDVLVPSFKLAYCTNERQELADELFTNVMQVMKELRQFTNICHSDDLAATSAAKPEELYEYLPENN